MVIRRIGHAVWRIGDVAIAAGADDSAEHHRPGQTRLPFIAKLSDQSCRVPVGLRKGRRLVIEQTAPVGARPPGRCLQHKAGMGRRRRQFEVGPVIGA